jgi:adenosylcobinamide-GDP ribazoletransferase
VLRADALWGLVCAPLLARWAIVPLVICFPYARPQGLGRALADYGAFPQLLLATALAAPCVVACGSRALLPSASALVAALATASLLTRRIGGLTGDGYGAAVELAELAFLATISLQRGP